MAEKEPLLGSNNGGQVVLAERESEATQRKTTTPSSRVVSLDVFRGLCVFLMILVDYAGSVFPSIAHSPWNGVRLADFVMPFFLFVVGVSLAIVNKIVLDRTGATLKVVIRTLKLFILGIFLQGGYLHGITGLTYGVDIERVRWMGILQFSSIASGDECRRIASNDFFFFVAMFILPKWVRIAVGYIVAALCEIWLPCQEMKRVALFRNYICQWCIMFLLSAIHCGLLYGLYVPDWQFSVSQSTGSTIYEVKCSVRGDLGPACNSAGMIDRYILGIDHLYAKPVYRNMKECNGSNRDTVSESMPSWCHAAFDPEGIVSSLTAAATSIIGLQYGHILVQFQDHKGRLYNWSILSLSLLAVGLFLDFIGMPLNKSLYTISYMLVTSGAAGITFCLLYLLVDIYGWSRLMFVLEWMGKHSLSIFILITSNIAVIFIQGFYWRDPQNNIVRWIVTRFVQK